MSQPSGTPDPDAPVDPWAAPSSGDGSGSRAHRPYPADEQPAYGDPLSGQPAYGQPPYGQPPYGQPPYGPYGQPTYAPYGYRPPTNGKAVAALWSGIGLLVLSCCALGVFGVVPIILGVKARSEIRAGGDQQPGAGMALAGIITGAVALVLSLLLIGLVTLALAGDGYASFDSSTTTSA
jgi:Domain of unknown function (DUF4190)